MAAVGQRILFVDHTGELGGAELSLLDLAAYVGDDGRVVLFSDGPLVRRLEDRHMQVEVLGGAASVLSLGRQTGIWRGLSAVTGVTNLALQLARLMRRNRLAYANSQKAAVITAMAALITRKPMVWHLHDIMTAPDFSVTNRKVVIALTNRATTLVIANSEATAAAYRQVGGRCRIVVVPNGIDPAPFDVESRAAARAKVSAEFATDGAPILALFGRICRWKGQEVAIAALQKLPAAHLLLVGAPLFGEEAVEAAMRQQVVAAGLESRVHFTGFRSDVASLMQGVDVVLHCSTQPEPFGRVIVESMMAGTPVVATSGGGATEILDESGAGLLVPPADPAALASAIGWVMEHRAAADAMGQTGRDLARQRYAADRINHDIGQLLAPLH